MSRHAVIIGAGITGLLTAIELINRGWKVTVAEAKHIGSGSSSRTAAGIRQQFSTPETVLGMRYSVNFYKNFMETVGGHTDPIVQNGYLFLLNQNIDDAISRVEMQRTAGLEDVHFLKPDDVKHLFPYVDSESIQGATWCSSDGFLRPGVIYGEAANAAQRLGVNIIQNAPINKVRIKNDLIHEVRAGSTWLSADLFIDCTNAWSPRLAALLGAQVLPIEPLKRYLWFVDRGEGFDEDTFAKVPMIITPKGAYCRPENRGSLLMGWAHTADSEPSFDHDDQDMIETPYSHTGFDSLAFEAWEAIAESIPPFGEFDGIAATTSGYYGTTPDHNPFLGYDPNRKNLLHLVGFSGHGAMFGPFTALAAGCLAEAGTDLEHISVLGEAVSMAAFALNREYHATEHMVI